MAASAKTLARVRPVAVTETQLCRDLWEDHMVVLGQDEGGWGHALAAELYLMRTGHLHAMHGAHQRQDVAGPGVHPAAHPVVVHPRRQV